MKWFIVLLCAASASVFSEWTVLENCQLVENQFNDGDSFLIESVTEYRGQTKHRIRLYFVDTAETSSNSDFMTDRLEDQAAYWGSADPDFALKMGFRAKQTVHKLLKGRFDVYTRGKYAPSMGKPRLYAMVRVKDRWLSEILVEQGLVRIYGVGADVPARTSQKGYRAGLQRLERVAKADRRNGWRGATDDAEADLVVFEAYDTVTASAAWIYSIKGGRNVTVLRKGTPVTVVSSAEDGRIRIRFEKNGKVYEGLCAKNNLDL